MAGKTLKVNIRNVRGEEFYQVDDKDENGKRLRKLIGKVSDIGTDPLNINKAVRKKMGIKGTLTTTGTKGMVSRGIGSTSTSGT